MSNHTPEPWTFESEPQYCSEIFGSDGMSVCAFVDDPSCVDVDRILSCVNACAGMADPAAEIAELKRQRDELLAALKEVTICAEGAMEQANADGAGWDIEFTLREANRLIAMTKGGESCSTTPTTP